MSMQPRPPRSLPELLCDALARIVWAREGLELDAIDEARQALYDLETDLVEQLWRIEERRAA